MPKSAGVSFVSEYHMDGNATTGGPIIAAFFNKTETRLRLKTGGKITFLFPCTSGTKHRDSYPELLIFRLRSFVVLAQIATHFRQNQVLASCVRVWSLIHNLCESRTSILSIACQSGVRISLTDSLNCHSPLLRLNIRYLRRRVKEKSTGHQEPLSLVTLPCSGWISRKVTDNAETSDSCINAWSRLIGHKFCVVIWILKKDMFKLSYL